VISIDDQSRPSLARGVRLQHDPQTDEPILLFPEGALYLSDTAHDIVKRCGEGLTTVAIIDSLAQDYEVEASTLRSDVVECLLDLQQRKLLVFSR
jgi:pyrroloquinoline quinone biosynthesis protein D